MRLTLVTIGRPKNKAVQSLITEYTTRLKRYCRFEHVVVSEGQRGDRDAIRRAQSDALLQAIPKGARLVVLDERGKAWTSDALARAIEHDQLHGDSHWALVIGGAEGHDERLRDAAHRVWSLSALTMPHELATVVVVEQLYRAMTILRGEPYHRED